MVCFPLVSSRDARFLSPSLPPSGLAPPAVDLGSRHPWGRRGVQSQVTRFRTTPHSARWLERSPSHASFLISIMHHSHLLSLSFAWKCCSISMRVLMACLGSGCSARRWKSRLCSTDGPPVVRVLPQQRQLVLRALRINGSWKICWNCLSCKQSQTCKMALMGTCVIIWSLTSSL